MPITVDEPSTTCSSQRRRRLFDDVRRHFDWSAKMKRYETWLVFGLVYVPVIPLLSAAILGGYLYLRSHRAVYFVNGLPVPIVVDIDGRHSISLGPHAHSRRSMAEGLHQAVVSEPRLGFEPVDFRIGGQGAAWLLNSPTLIVDPTRSAILVWEESPSSSAKGERPEAESRAHLGEAFLAYPHVDYLFEEFPNEPATGRPAELRTTRISLVAAPAEKLVQAILAAPDRAGDTIGLIENRLRASPDDVALLSGYWAIARRYNHIERCREFLTARLSERPVLTDWHRLYQTVSEDLGEHAALIEQYRGWLAAEPDNSALLYLRGRCEPDRDAALRLYDRAIAADPDNPYPHFAESGIFLSRGEFGAAENAARISCRLRPGNAPFNKQLTKARLALRRYEELESELRAALRDNPEATTAQERLLAVLVAAGKEDQAAMLVKSLCPEATASADEAEVACTHRLQNTLLYLRGDFQGLLAVTEPPADSTDSAVWRYQARFELGQQVKPPAGVKPLSAEHDGYSLLCQALAWAEHGEAAAAEEAKNQAIEQFRGSRHDDRRVADILAKGGRWTDKDLDNLPLDPTHKCILLVAMAEASADRRGALIGLAEQLNFERPFPYHFLRRTIERLQEHTNFPR